MEHEQGFALPFVEVMQAVRVQLDVLGFEGETLVLRKRNPLLNVRTLGAVVFLPQRRAGES